MSDLHIYNSLTRQKEKFEPITPGHIGMYVCGPTVSGESHLGHARPYITFDVVYRYLIHLGYKVRYVRNITDAGHFEEEGRVAEDKVAEKAKLEMLEPMELVHKYTNLFHWGMHLFNTLDPSIEPTATGHIIEQIAMIEDIIQKGFAYEVNGSVYFDVKKYAESYPYGKLSGRILDDLLETTRDLDGQDEKRNKVDFALWKSAPPQHIMRWKSPWGEGFPGWHIECSAMASKYLGETFDIHGGGMDLQFPHHESEIAQSTIAHGHAPVRYWMHNNMITINGKKMGKSYNNVIKLTELFSGNHPILEQAYHPMVVRFYILQTHYRSTLDFSNEALQASEKALKRLWEAYEVLNGLTTNESVDIHYYYKSYVQETDASSKSFSFSNLLKNDDVVELSKAISSFENELLFIERIQSNLTRWKTINANENDDIIFSLAKKFISTYISNNEKYSALSQSLDNPNFIDTFKATFYSITNSDAYRKRIELNSLIRTFCDYCDNDMNDDLNTAKVIANLFELAPIVNSVKGGQISSDALSSETLQLLKDTFKTYLEDILGLQGLQAQQSDTLDKVLSLLIEMRKDARARKDWAASDQIRIKLAEAGVLLKDGKDGSVSYTIE